MNNKIISVILFIIIAVIFAIAIKIIIKRAKHGSACCGEHIMTEKSKQVKDKNKKNYPYSVKLKVTGMTCKNCAIKIENALNELDGIWAKVDKNNNTAFILSKKEINVNELFTIIARAGYIATLYN